MYFGLSVCVMVQVCVTGKGVHFSIFKLYPILHHVHQSTEGTLVLQRQDKAVHRIMLSVIHVNHVYISVQFMGTIMQIITNPHIPYILEKRNSYCHIIHNLWGSMMIYMNCTAANNCEESWESQKNHENHLRITGITQES